MGHLTSKEFVALPEFQEFLVQARRRALRERNRRDSAYRAAVEEDRITYDELMHCELEDVLIEELFFEQGITDPQTRFSTLYHILAAWKGTTPREELEYRLDINRRYRGEPERFL